MKLSDEQEKTDINWKGLLQLILAGGVMLLGLMLFAYLFDFLKFKANLLYVKSKYGHRFDNSNKNQRIITKIYAELGMKRFLKILPFLQNNQKMIDLYQEEVRNNEVVISYYELVKASKAPAEIKSANYTSDFLFALSMICDAGLAEIEDQSAAINKDLQQELGIIESLVRQAS